MLLEEEPSTLLRRTIDNFHIAPDKAAVARVAESLSTLQQARELRLRASADAVRKLARTLSTLQGQHDELATGHSVVAHASEIARLDTAKFRAAKAASDLEMETERLQAQLADIQARLQELEMQGEDGGAAEAGVDDEVLLRLKVYRSLGIELDREGENGEFNKAVVRNDRKGDVHVVNMDKKFSRYFYANYFWQLL